MECQVCLEDMSNMSVSRRQEHYDAHFSDRPQAGPSSPNSGQNRSQTKYLKPKSPQKSQWRFLGTENDTFWHPAQTSAPPSNFTPGLVPLLKKALLKSHAKGTTQKAYLCSQQAVHINSEFWDRGWGCGYRNFEMACAALMGQETQPLYFPLLDSPIPPGVRRLQQWIEDAWREGYDDEGARQLHRKLVETTKWIGTAELYVAFTSRGIPSQLVDFDLGKRGPDILLNWIVNYFTQDPPKSANINDALRGAEPIVITNKMPLVLQHAGHSRTVIGYEKSEKGAITLLMFDPARSIHSTVRKVALVNHSSSTPGHIEVHRLSPKKIVQKVLHPNRYKDSGSKRRASDAGNDSTTAKRLRAGSEKEVIVIDEEEDIQMNAPVSGNNHESAPRIENIDFSKILKGIRVSTGTLGRKDKYQILYFPLTDPLDDVERHQHKVVTSKKII